MQDASGPTSCSQRWYRQAARPSCDSQDAYDEAARTYTLEVAQDASPSPRSDQGAVPHPARHRPVGAGWRRYSAARRSESETPTTRVLDVRSPRQLFRFLDVPSPRGLRCCAGSPPPVRLEFPIPIASSRSCGAGQRSGEPLGRSAAHVRHGALWVARERRAGKPLAVPAALEQVVARLLADTKSDPRSSRVALTPPDLAYVAAREATWTPKACAARTHLVREWRSAASRVEAVLHRHRPGTSSAFTGAEGHAGSATSRFATWERSTMSLRARWPSRNTTRPNT